MMSLHTNIYSEDHKYQTEYLYLFNFFFSAGLFEPEHVAQELAFKAAIEKMNLHQVVGSSRMIVYHVEHTTAHDSFEANKEGKST